MIRRFHCPAAYAAFALIVLTNAPAVAAQREADPAAEIMQKFGSGGRLSFDGLRAYLADREFARLDVNENGELDPDEHRAALLFVRRADCLIPANASAQWQNEKQAAAGAIDAVMLYRVNPVWKLHIDEMVAAHWDRTGLQRNETLVSYRPIVGHSFSPIGGQAFSPEWGPPVFGR